MLKAWEPCGRSPPPGPPVCARRGAAGDAQGHDPARPRPQAGWLPGVADRRPAPDRSRAFRRGLRRDGHAAAGQEPEPVLAEAPPPAPESRPYGAGPLQKGPADGGGRPSTPRVELWFMDEARIGQRGRATHVW